MKIEKKSIAGSLQSNDCLVSLEPYEGIEINIDSPLIQQFGDKMEEAVREQLKEMGVSGCKVSLEDRGALDCTIRARVEVAVRRANV